MRAWRGPAWGLAPTPRKGARAKGDRTIECRGTYSLFPDYSVRARVFSLRGAPMFATPADQHLFFSLVELDEAFWTAAKHGPYPSASTYESAVKRALHERVRRRARVLLCDEARRVGVKPATARNWARRGKLPGSVKKVGGRWLCYLGDLESRGRIRRLRTDGAKGAENRHDDRRARQEGAR